MYHSISESGGFFCVKPNDFERQMDYLCENDFNVIPLEKLVWYLENNNFPPKTIVLTFDDGYEDNFTNVFPVLKNVISGGYIFGNRYFG